MLWPPRDTAELEVTCERCGSDLPVEVNRYDVDAGDEGQAKLFLRDERELCLPCARQFVHSWWEHDRYAVFYVDGELRESTLAYPEVS